MSADLTEGWQHGRVAFESITIALLVVNTTGEIEQLGRCNLGRIGTRHLKL